MIPGIGDHFCPSLLRFPHILTRELLQLCDTLKDCSARSNYSQGPFFPYKQYVRPDHVNIHTLREGTLLGREMNTNLAVKRPQVCCTLAELLEENAWGVAVLLRIVNAWGITVGNLH